MPLIVAALLLALCAATVHAQETRRLHPWPLVSGTVGPERADVDVLWPFYHYERDGTFTYRGVRPFYSWATDPAREFRRLNILWPLSSFDRRGEYGRSYVFPLYRHRWGPDYSFRMLAPFYFHNVRPGFESLHAWPLYSRIEKEGEYREAGFIYPLFRWRRYADGGYDRHLPWPLVRFSEHNGRLSQYVLPFYMRHAGPDSSQGFFTLYYWNRTPARSRIGLFPLWSHERAGGTFTDGLMPLYHLKKGPGTTEFAMPWLISPEFSLFRLKASETRLKHRLFPLYSYEARRDTGARKFSMLGPLFSYRRNPSADRVAVRALLFSRERRGGDITNTLPPLWYMRTHANGDRFGFAGLWFWKKNQRGSTHGLFPLGYAHRGADGSRNGYAGPYYWRESETSRTRGVFPVWHQGRKSDGTGLTMVLPFYLNNVRADGHSRFITPLWFDSATRTETGTRHTRLLFPLALDLHDEGAGTRFSTILPALWFHNRTPERTFTVQFPFYWRMRDNTLDTELTYWFPFYGTYRQGDHLSRHFLFFPLYARYRDTAEGTAGWDVLWPLFHHDTGPGHAHTRALPFYWHSAGVDSSLRVVFPLYWSWRDRDRSQLHLLPVYSRIRNHEGHLRQYFVGPLFTTLRDDTRDLKSWSALFGLAHGERQGDIARNHVFPLWRYRHDHATGALKWGVLPPVTWYARDPQAGTLSINALLYYRRQKPDSDFHMLLPFWWRSQHGDTVTDSVPLLFRHARNPVEKWRDTALLWLFHPEISLWRRQAGPEFIRHRIPLVYGYRKNFLTGARRFSSLGGLIARETDPARDLSLTRVLLYESRREGAYRRTALFPFWWHTVNGETSSTVIPLLYHAERDPLVDLNAHSVLWLVHPEIAVWRYERDGAEVTRRLFPLFRHTGNRETGLNEGWAAAGLVSWKSDPAHQHKRFRALLYSREVTATTTRTQFLPFYSRLNTPDRLRTTALPFYYHDRNTAIHRDARGVITLGVPQLSLYHHLNEGGVTKDRLFPLYGYQSEPATGRKAFSVLWPLFSVDRSKTYREDPDPMLTLVSYRKNGDDARFRFLWRLIYFDRSPRGSSFEFNPLFGWDRGPDGKVTEWWALFGIIGHRTRPDGTGDLLIFGF